MKSNTFVSKVHQHSSVQPQSGPSVSPDQGQRLHQRQLDQERRPGRQAAHLHRRPRSVATHDSSFPSNDHREQSQDHYHAH